MPDFEKFAGQIIIVALGCMLAGYVMRSAYRRQVTNGPRSRVTTPV